jgi:hypothetical protein
MDCNHPIDHHQEQANDQLERRKVEKQKMRLDFEGFFFFLRLLESLVDTVL